MTLSYKNDDGSIVLASDLPSYSSLNEVFTFMGPFPGNWSVRGYMKHFAFEAAERGLKQYEVKMFLLCVTQERYNKVMPEVASVYERLKIYYDVKAKYFRNPFNELRQ